MRGAMDYFSRTKHVLEMTEKLAVTAPKVPAVMHGAAWRGHGARLHRQLASRLAV
jgi:hypothetical protein